MSVHRRTTSLQTLRFCKCAARVMAAACWRGFLPDILQEFMGMSDWPLFLSALQVKQVYGVGQNCEGFGRHLNGLFKQAITAGKRVRAETKISSGAVSVSSAAAELAALKLPTQRLQDAKVPFHCHVLCVRA